MSNIRGLEQIFALTAEVILMNVEKVHVYHLIALERGD